MCLFPSSVRLLRRFDALRALALTQTLRCVYRGHMHIISLFPPLEDAASRGRRLKLESVGGSLPWGPRETILQLSVVALMVEGFRGTAAALCPPRYRALEAFGL